jgi:hypothetical protein
VTRRPVRKVVLLFILAGAAAYAWLKAPHGSGLRAVRRTRAELTGRR